MSRFDAIRQPLGLALLTFAVLLVLSLTHAPSPTAPAADMPLGIWLEGVFAAPVLLQSLRAVIAFANAILLSGLIVRYGLCPTRTYLPIPLYVALSGLFLPAASAGTLLITLLTVLHVTRMTACFRRSYQFEHLFLASLYLGLLPMISSAATPLLLTLPVALFLYRRTAREAIVALAGVLLPLLFCSVIWWGMGHAWNHILTQWGLGLAAARFGFFLPEPTVPATATLVMLCACGLLLLLALLRLVRTLPALRPRPRSIYLHMLWLLLCSLTTLFFCPDHATLAYAVSAVPATVIACACFAFHGRRYALIAYTVFIVVTAIVFATPLFA